MGYLKIKRLLTSGTSSLLGSLIAVTETLWVQTNSNIQLVNYLDIQGTLIVDGVLGVQ